MSEERHAYTKLPGSNAPKAKSAGLAAGGSATAVAAFLVILAAAAALLPAPQPPAQGDEPAAFQAPAAIERASGAMHAPTSMSPIPPAAFADKISRASAGPARAEAGFTSAEAPAKAVSLLGQANGGFVPFGSEREYDREAIRKHMYVPPGAAGGMAPGAGMGEGVTACEGAELLARNAAQQRAHYGPSVAAYGKNAAAYGPSVAAYGGSVAAYGGSVASYGANVASYGTSGAAYGSSVAGYGSSGAAYGPSVASYGSSGAGYAAPAAANCAKCASK
jgi:hypothetical protein